MKNTSFRVEDIFGDVLNKEIFSQEQITKLNHLLAKKMWKKYEYPIEFF